MTVKSKSDPAQDVREKQYEDRDSLSVDALQLDASFVRHNPAPVFLIDEDGRISVVNPATVGILGRDFG